MATAFFWHVSFFLPCISALNVVLIYIEMRVNLTNEYARRV